MNANMKLHDPDSSSENSQMYTSDENITKLNTNLNASTLPPVAILDQNRNMFPEEDKNLDLPLSKPMTRNASKQSARKTQTNKLDYETVVEMSKSVEKAPSPKHRYQEKTVKIESPENMD